jgi:flagellar basal-body rod protein FlgB
MINDLGAVDTARLLVTGMRVAAVNHRFLAGNIANADTPGYNPVELDFRKVLAAELSGHGGLELRKSHPEHLTGRGPGVQFERLAYLSKNDYNKVDVDDQLAKLAENRGRYVTYARLLAKKFEMAQNMLNNLSR